MMEKELIKVALGYREKAYVPYSKFKVGAALLTKKGEVIGGCNIENVSLGATNCAERTALFTAIAKGHKEFEAIAVVGDLNNITAPCGICRQVMVEFFKKDMKVILATSEENYIIKTLEEIMPFSFGKEALL